ncbi:hypothetical protein ACJJIQ_03105 [Microbulbifer sp. ANSA003]|uniref:hypothetical protein n=1 Tax=Microbulbifer sp. ANSA003 TaxID=3243360 RepID=UPI00404110B2
MIEEFTIHKSPEEWASIHSKMIDSGWDDFTLERQGDLTVWLTHHQKDEYRDNWNRLAGEYRPKVKAYVSVLAKEQGINADLASYLEWDLLHLYIESYFQKFDGAPLFYIKHTAKLYSKNEIPCGWEGVYPNGQIVCQ